MSETFLTHKDLAAYLHVSETTVKSYRRKFPGCIPVANNGKPIRFTPEAKAVCKKIRDLFATGMSVEEVRARLAAEFSWISEEAEPAEKKELPQTAIVPELSSNMSDMAKNMVHIAGQQKLILQRVQGIESFLEELGIDRSAFSDEERQKRNEQKRQSEMRVEARLDVLDTTAKELAQTVSSLAQGIDSFIRQQQEKERLQSIVSQSSQALQSNTAEETSSIHEEKPPLPIQQEPPRQLLSYPLFAKVGEGQYVSAGGRHRGNFCVNDLKALLVYGYTPPHHYSLEWIQQGDDWWLSLSQAQIEGGHSLQLLLRDLITQRGHVLEIIQVVNSGVSVPPADICSILDSLVV